MALEEYYVVRESYFNPRNPDELISKGEIIHRKSSAFLAEHCDPVKVRHDVEQMTAEPGEKRRTRLAS